MAASTSASDSADETATTIVDEEGSTTGPSTCGNGVIDPGEVCDGVMVMGTECGLVGPFAGGELICDSTDCSTFDTNACVACDDVGPLLGGPCPKECSFCEGNTCVFQCDTPSACTSSVSCADGWDCEIRCLGTDACITANIVCPPIRGCQLDCQGSGACDDARLLCKRGPCHATCGAQSNSCRDFRFDCGANTTSLTCDAPQQGLEVVYPDEPETMNCTCDVVGC